MDERRKFPRLNVAVDVAWGRASEEASPRKKARRATKNISAGGICLIVYDEVKVGERLNLLLTLPTGRTIRAVGCVVWASAFEVSGDQERDRHDIGSEFVEIDNADRKEIQNFIWSQPPTPDP